MASSIAVAEAAKVIENTQRDVNIALINELALIFKKLNLDSKEVLNASRTKWNFLPFEPGLVGGHCIGVDPYYLTHKAMEVGYVPEIILAGRKINDNIGSFVAISAIEELTNRGIKLSKAKISILGLTFKENCPDMRNTKVISIIETLKKYECSVLVSDECADKGDAIDQFGIDLVDISSIQSQDILIIAVSHKSYFSLDEKNFGKMLKPNGMVMDVKSIFSKKKIEKQKFKYWNL